MISQTSSAAMQNFKGSCCSLIAFVVQTQLSGEERHCNAEVNFVRLLDDHPFHFGQQSDNDAVSFFNRWPRADLVRQQICGGADEVRSL